MAPLSSLVSKLKVQLKLSISRLRMTQQKDQALAKQQRRAMAVLIEQGKLESARIRVENIITSDITTELLEILELYCELLLARINLLDPPTNSPSLGGHSSNSTPQVDPGLEEAVRSLIYAAPRTDVKELHAVRSLLVDKFGKDFALSAVEGEGVADRVITKLKVEAPKPELVDAYLREIARTYGVRFPGDPVVSADDDDDDEPSDGVKVKALEAPVEAEELVSKVATPPRDVGPRSPPVKIAPPSPSTENITPKIRLPGPPDLKPGPKMKKAPAESKDDSPGGKIPDFEDLQKRFAALKR